MIFKSNLSRIPFEFDSIGPTDSMEVMKASMLVKCGKGLGIDTLPDWLIKSKSELLWNKFVALINAIFLKKDIPKPFCLSRLHLLNKLKDGSTPTIDDLRPIMISSPIVKIIEAIALIDLKEVLEPKIICSQIGFLPHLGT